MGSVPQIFDTDSIEERRYMQVADYLSNDIDYSQNGIIHKE